LADYLQQIPLVNEPELRIDRFTLNEAHEYFGSDRNIFSDIWGVAIAYSGGKRRFYAADPVWHRLIYGEQGFKGVKSLWEDRLYQPWDMTAWGDKLFVTDQGHGCVYVYEGLTGAVRPIRKGLRWPKGIAYSDNGTPSDPNDDFILVCDVVLDRVFMYNAKTGDLLQTIGKTGRWKGQFFAPLDLAVGKTVDDGAETNTDDIYVLDEGNDRIVHLKLSDPEFWQTRPVPPDVRFRSIDADACGNILVATSQDQIVIYDSDLNEISSYGPIPEIHDIFVRGNEVIVSQRWEADKGITLYRITNGCAGDTCMLAVRIADPRDRQIIRADSIPLKGEVFCKSHPDPGYGYVKYWVLYIASGWDIVGTFAFLAGAPGATDDEDTLCWLVADTFPAGKYTLLLKGISNEGLEKEDRVRITIMHGLPTDPTFTYMRKPDGTQWYPMMSIVPMSTPVEVGWRIVGPAGRLRFKLSTNNALSYQDISGWLSPGNLVDDSTYEGSWVWNTPNFPSRKIRLLMEVYDTAGEYSSSCEIAPAVVVVSDVGGITAGNGGRKLALGEDGVLHMAYATGKVIRDTMNPGLEDIQSSIYYTYSEDLGMSWKPPRLVSAGRDPAIAVFDNGSAGIAYLSDRADTLYYRPINKAGNPGRPTVLNVSANLYGSPAITVRGGRAYVIAETYNSAQARLGMWEIRKEGQLVQFSNLAGPWSETPASPVEVVAVPIDGKRKAQDTVYYVLLNPQGSPSVATDITGRLHVVWDRGSEIWYGRETDTGWTLVQVSDSGVLAGDPCLDVQGGNAHIIWEEDRRVLVRKYGFVESGFWSPRPDTVAEIAFTPGWFNYPVIDKGGAVSWTTTSVGACFRGISLIQYKRERGDWGDGNLISDYPWADHPQLEITPENLTAAWSQGFWETNPSWSRPFGRFYLATKNLSQENPPFWWVELGDETPTPYTIHRGGFAVYPSGKRADVDSAYLSYGFPLFEPAESELWLMLYYEGDEDWRGVSLRVNDQDFGNFWYPEGEALWVRCEPGLADNLDITLSNIGGAEVSLAGIYVYTTHTGKMEATALTGGFSGLPVVLSLNAPYPNPAKGKATLSYAIPGQYEGQPLSLRVYDVSGRRRLSLVEGRAKAGIFTVPFTGESLSGGFYFVVLRVGQEQRIQKLAWVR